MSLIPSFAFFRRNGIVLLALLASSVCGAATEHPLRWDAMEKRAEPKFEDGTARFVFQVTNTAKVPVKIYWIRPSCGCTTVDAPRMPWTLAAGERGTVTATVDFLGKEGEIAKQLLVSAVAGIQTLTMIIKVPPMTAGMRERNQTIAAANRQKVFEGDCAACHARPAENQYGEDLYEAVCAVCHQSKQRGAMVPDLAVAKERRDAAWWTRWIEDGREGTLMPGFAQKHGGPLDTSQVESVVEYLLTAFPREPAVPRSP